MNSRRSVLAALGSALASMGLVFTRPASAAASRPHPSPHGTAIVLVLKNQQDAIRALELRYLSARSPHLPGDDAWWHDTLQRQWSVRRPVAPGRVDSTRWFEVSISIDGEQLGSWSVDTRKGTVTATPSPDGVRDAPSN